MVIIVFYISYLTNLNKDIKADLEERYLLFGLWGVVTRIPAYSDVRNQAAAEAFFRQATIITGIKSTQITTDKEPALYPAVKSVFGKSTKHYNSKYKNNCIEQDHRPIKSRLRVMKGLKSIFSALTFCTAFEEIRHFFCMNNKTRSERRHFILSKIQGFNNVATITA